MWGSRRRPGGALALALIVASTIVVSGWSFVGGLPGATAGGGPSAPPVRPTPAVITPGASVGAACSAVSSCTTAALSSVSAGDALVLVVATEDVTPGAPTSVSEVTSAGSVPMVSIGGSACTGTVRGNVFVYGLANVAAQTSVKFTVQYAAAETFTLHALDVAGAAPAPFEAAGASTCATNPSTTATVSLNTTVAGDLVVMAIEVRAAEAISATGGDALVNQQQIGGSLATSGALLDSTAAGVGLANLSATFGSARWSAMAIGIKPVPPLVSGTVSPGSATLDAGQKIALSATAATGGSSSYGYLWHSGSSTCSLASPIAGATSLAYTSSPLAAGGYDYCLWTTDLVTSQVVYSNVATVSVNAALGVTVTPAFPSIDHGQSVTMTAHPNGGTSPFTYAWYAGASCSGASLGTAAAYTTPVLTATATYCIAVGDSSHVPATATATDTVTVSATALGLSVSPSAPAIDRGQSVTLQAFASGGTGADTYGWYSGSVCAGALLAVSENYTTPALYATTSYCVSATDAAYQPVTATATVTVSVSASALGVTVSPPNPSIDRGQSVTLLASPTGGTGSDSYAWYAGSGCAGTVVGNSATYATGPLSVNASYCVAVTDQAFVPVTASAIAAVIVSPAALSVAVIPGAPALDLGQSVSIAGSPSGGTAPYSYAWYAGMSCVGTVLATTSTYTTPALFTNTSYCAAVTDSAYAPVRVTASVTVSVSSTALGASVSPSAATIDPGQGLILTASGTGGTPTYSFAWYAGASCTGTVVGSGPSYATPSLSSSAKFCVAVSDSAYAPETADALASITVSTAGLSVSVDPSSPTIDYGQSVTLSPVVLGGTGTDAFAWFAGIGCSGTVLSTAAVYTTASLTVSSSFCVRVTDGSYVPETVNATADVTVSGSALSLALTPSAPGIDYGQSVNLSAFVSGGTAPYSVSWFAGGVCTGTVLATTTYYLTPSLVAAASYCVSVSDSALRPVTVTAVTSVAVSSAALSVGVAPGAPSIDRGQTVLLTASVSGGTAPYGYTWFSGPGCGGSVLASTPAWTSPSLTANSTYCVVVTDSAYAPASANASVVVSVSAQPLVLGPISPAAPSIDHGQSVQLSVAPTGGTGGYSYTWYQGATCTGTAVASLASWTTPPLTSNTTFCVSVTDGAYSPVTVSGTVFVTVSPSALEVFVTPNGPSVDFGQSIALVANASGGTGPYVYAWFSGAVCAGPVLATTPTYPTGALRANATYCVAVTDSAQVPATVSSSDSLVVSAAALTPGAITPHAPTIDPGQSLTLAANPSGGTGPYTYLWYVGPSCSGTVIASSVTFATGPLSANTTFCVLVTDAAYSPVSVNVTVTVTVGSGPLSASVSPPTASIDHGQTIVLSANAQAGTGPYRYAWYAGSVCSGAVVGTSANYSAGPLTANASYCVAITDSSVVPASASATATVTVSARPLLVGPVVPGAPTLDPGQSVVLSVNVSGGTGAHSYAWFAGSACTGSPLATTPTLTTGPLEATRSFCVTVTDSSSVPASGSASVTVSVSPAALAVGIVPHDPRVDYGQSLTLNATVTGGTGPLGFAWYASTACTGSVLATSASYPTGPLTANTTFCVRVVDSAYAPENGSALTNVSVSPSPLALTILPAAPLVDIGQNVTLTANATGGTGPLAYGWYAGAGCWGDLLASARQYTTPALLANATYCVVVTDGALAPVTLNATVRVTVNTTALYVSVSPESPAVDRGQSVVLTASVLGGTRPYSYAWYAGATCVGSVVGSAPSFASGPLLHSAAYCVDVTDSALTPSHRNASTSVSVSPAALSVAVDPNAPAIDPGQTVTLTATPAGGTGSVGFAWYAGAACNGTVLSSAAVFSTVALGANSTFCVRATDSAYVPANATALVDVAVAAAALGVSVGPSGPSIDAGQTVTMNATVTGGIGPFSYAWYASAACTGGVLGTAATYSTATWAASATYCVKVTDSSWSPASATASDVVTVSASALSVTVAPVAPSLDHGQAVTLTAHPVGGTGAESFAWYATASCTGPVLGTAASYTTNALNATTTFCVRVTDSSFEPANANATARVAVSPTALAASVSPGSVAVDHGQTISLTASASGGTGSYSYAWYAGASCVGTVLSTAPEYTTAPLSGSTSYCLAVTDSASSPARVTALALVTVSAAPLSVAVSPHATTVGSGSVVTFTANVTGGTGPVSYAWYEGPSCSGVVVGTEPTFTTSALSSSVTYCVSVTDSSAQPASARATGAATVLPPSGGATPFTFPGGISGLLAVLAGVVAVIAALLFVFGRRRRSEERSGPAEESDASSSGASAENGETDDPPSG